MTSISGDTTVQNEDTHSATSELKAAARDVLRVGKQWVHAAQEWFDDRRNEMNNRNRDERDYEAGSARQDRNYESGHQSRHGYALPEQVNRGRDRSDYDIQSDYSSGGYDQLSPGQDLNVQRSFQGSAREQSEYLERGVMGARIATPTRQPGQEHLTLRAAFAACAIRTPHASRRWQTCDSTTRICARSCVA